MKRKRSRRTLYTLPTALAFAGSGVTLLAVLLTANGSFALSAAEETKSAETSAKNEEKKEDAKAAKKEIEVNLDEASAVVLPHLTQDLKPATFKTKDDRQGWIVRIPGSRPIATPAYADGKIFVGGGYGSHEFYAFNADTGSLEWQYKTDDDGPTAAVVEAGCAAFNTESCTVYVLNTDTGKLLWKEWLGDPLMAQPAIADGKLYMSYPNSGRHHFNNSIQKNWYGSIKPSAKPGSGNKPRMSHSLLCADLKTGKHLWEAQIPAEVITAPVIDGKEVYLACHDGTSMCIDTETGNVNWQKKNNATSAPLVASGKVITSERQNKNKQVFEGFSIIAKAKAGEHLAQKSDPSPALADATFIASAGAMSNPYHTGGLVSAHGSYMPEAWSGDEFVDGPEWHQSGQNVAQAPPPPPPGTTTAKTTGLVPPPPAVSVSTAASASALPPPPPAIVGAPSAQLFNLKSAPYLASANKSIVGMSQKKASQLDSSVGFGIAPGAANLSSAGGNTGVNTVAGAWAYQGSRAAHVYGDEGSFASGGDSFYGFNTNSGAVNWSAKARGMGVDPGSQVFAPPALGKQSMYLVSGQGHLLSVGKDNGHLNFMYALKHPITFQPALAKGNIYIGTSAGQVICLKTGDPDADGWTAWGGNARHNK